MQVQIRVSSLLDSHLSCKISITANYNIRYHSTLVDQAIESLPRLGWYSISSGPIYKRTDLVSSTMV